ncbi:GGDEF domain-containing protein [Aminipila sp.]|jgi:diguanylate cyclase (GGDEF)-like protein|uniref:GGDEF domain-containing protein n=1 Tax=Aminipila sp. TaxID=2060095 RepID=UPI001E12D36B|nr:diguanylate cyclase [Aminipila sp.]MBE6033960.1 diguanylate cyclase [Clostridiales bacterium]
MFEFKQMSELLKPYCTGESIFDFYRLIDPKTHEVFEYDKDNNLRLQEGSCYELWERNTTCPNCITKHSCVKQRQYVKLEFLQGKVMLIITKPVKIQNKMLGLELIKDITFSMLGFNYFRSENKNVQSIVSQFNELIVKDILTGLFNLDYIKNYLDNFIQKEAVFNTLTAAAIDVDNYTEINSLYGYTVGNQVLQYIAGIMDKTAVAHGAVAGRLGPDEMGIFFIDKTAAEVEKICEEIYEQAACTPLKIQENSLDIGFAYAIASLEAEDETDDFIGRLYFNLRAAQGQRLK